jgi:fructokinase
MTMSTLHQPKRPTLVGCGFVAWDVVLSDSLSVAYTGVGGTVGNVMSIMAFLGWHTVPVVRLGDDSAGVNILSELVALGVDIRSISLDSSLTTPVVYQYYKGSSGDHDFTFKCPHCGHARHYSDALLSDLDPSVELPLGGGDVYFFDRLTESSVSLAEQAIANGALTVFEPSALGSDKDLFLRALRAAQVVKYSGERLATSAMPELGAGFVEIQTLGAAGLRFRMRSLDPTWVTISSIQLSAVTDTAGAGDWCTAGFLHLVSKHLRGGMLSDLRYNHVYAALRAGQALAALNCQHTGARGLMRHTESARIREVLYQLEHDAAQTVSRDSLSDWSDAVAAQVYRFTISDVAAYRKPAATALQCCYGNFGFARNAVAFGVWGDRHRGRPL